MDANSTQQLKHALNTEVVRRMLIKYFVESGYENFDTLIYPASLQNMPMVIQELYTKIEVEPHALNIDPLTDSAKIGWNLFVLGEQRMYLGETYHSGLKTLAQQLQTGQVVSEGYVATKQTTPRRIIHFVTSALSKVEAGYTDLNPSIQPNLFAFGNRLGSNMAQSNQFFTRSGYGT